MAAKPLNPVHPRDSHDALQPHAVEPEPVDRRQEDADRNRDERPGADATAEQPSD